MGPTDLIPTPIRATGYHYTEPKGPTVTNEAWPTKETTVTSTEGPSKEVTVEKTETVTEVPVEASEVTQVTEVTEVAPEPEKPHVQPEPTLIGHQVVQDNVSHPGEQRTHSPEGELTSTTAEARLEEPWEKD
jgi:hypothetical protein